MSILLDFEVRTTTELSKKTKDVLNSASDGMVVIHREQPNADIAMLKHETFKRMAAAHQMMPQIVGVLRYVAAFEDAEVGATPPTDFDWLRAFDVNDLREFSVEYLSASMRILQGEMPLGTIEEVVTQWRRSAEVLLNDEIRGRLQRERSLILEG